MSTTLVSNGVTGSAECVVTATGANYVSVSTNSSERARVDSSGNVLVGTTSSATRPTTSGSLSASNTFGFKNRLINGAMTIDQRNGGVSVTPTTDSQYTLDRWAAMLSAASKYSVQQGAASNPSGYPSALLVTSLAATTITTTSYYCMNQRIEGFNVADLGWGAAGASPVTLSFWVRSSKTGTFGGSIRNAGVNRSYPFTYSISAANTWEQKAVVIPGDTTGTWATGNTIGMYVMFGLGVGSTYSGTAGAWAAANYLSATGATSIVNTSGATWYITGVQLEKGTAATSFDFRPYTTELLLCQRYYYEKELTSAGQPTWITFTANGDTRGCVWHPTKMRTTPSVGFSSSTWVCIAFGDLGSNANLNADNVTPANLTDESWGINVTGNSGALVTTIGGVAAWGPNAVVGAYVDAEL